MKAHLIYRHMLVLRSRLSAKVKVNVKYQGHISKKKKKNGRGGGEGGALVFHKRILFSALTGWFTYKLNLVLEMSE